MSIFLLHCTIISIYPEIRAAPMFKLSRQIDSSSFYINPVISSSLFRTRFIHDFIPMRQHVFRSRQQPSAADSFDKLSEGVKYGLQRLVNENAETVKQMLSAAKTANATELCELCAQVMQQQQLSPSSFLARFFDKTILAAHCSLLGKSCKGNAPALAERIASAWLKRKTRDLASDVTSRNLENDEGKKKERGLETEPATLTKVTSEPSGTESL